jgi:hypothetical protein
MFWGKGIKIGVMRRNNPDFPFPAMHVLKYGKKQRETVPVAHLAMRHQGFILVFS